MAYSARILALIQRIEAADAAHLDRLRQRAKKEADARAKIGEEPDESPAGESRLGTCGDEREGTALVTPLGHATPTVRAGVTKEEG